VYKKIFLDKEIYPPKVVKKALKEFPLSLNFTVSEKKEGFLITFKDKKKEIVEQVKNEFCNYLIYLIQLTNTLL
jgi:His-Xaa-Ser system protein HxsD